VAEFAWRHCRLELILGEISEAVHSQCVGMTFLIVRVDQRNVRLRAHPVESNYARSGGGGTHPTPIGSGIPLHTWHACPASKAADPHLVRGQTPGVLLGRRVRHTVLHLPRGKFLVLRQQALHALHGARPLS
jgi:hypothetical protein